MYAIRYTLLCLLFSLLSISNVSSQVFGVDFLLEYEPDSCAYIASIIIVDGQASSPLNRTQLNSTYTIVTPVASTLSLVGSYAPFKNNIVINSSDDPIQWTLSNFAIGPSITPSLSYWSVVPDLSTTSFYNELNLGDTVKIFGFEVDPLMNCGDEVRIFENGSDPNSSQMPMGLDYSCGFVVGNDPDQDYRENRDLLKPPMPQVEFTIDCSGDVTIVPDTIGELICEDALPYSYIWTGPNSFFSTDENPIIPPGTGNGEYCAQITDGFGCDTIICQWLETETVSPINEVLCNTDPYTLIYAAGGAGMWVFDPSSNMTGATIGTTFNGDAEVTFDSNASGEYSFIYAGGGGCAALATLNIMPSTSEPNVDNDGPMCPGEITTLTADDIPGATYVWTGPETGNDRILQVTTAGTYTLTMTVGGCPSMVEVIVVYNDTPESPIPGVNSPVCENKEVNFTASNVTGATDSDYTWTQISGSNSNVFNEQNPTITSVTAGDAGTYELVVEINGCESIPVTINLVVESTPSIPIIDPIAPVCEGGIITLNTNSSGTAVWTHPDMVTTFNGSFVEIDPASSSDEGVWTLVVTDGNCDSEPATVQVDITDKPASSTPNVNSPVCVGEQVNFTATNVAGASDLDYTWTQTSGANNNVFNEQNPSITMASLGDAGTYELVVTINGCDSDPVTVNLVVNNSAAAPTANIDGPACDGDDVDFITDPVSGATYTWTNSSCPNSPIVTSDATFTFTGITSDCGGVWELIVDLNGCMTDPATANLQVNDTPDTPAPSSNTDVCIGETIELFANTTTATSWEWYFESFLFSTQENPSISNAALADGGVYELFVTENGCRSEAGMTTVVVNDKPATPSASSNSPICSGDAIELYTDPVSGSDVMYIWTGPTNIQFMEQNPVITGSSAIAGTYTLVVKVDGCESDPTTTEVIINPTPPIPSISSNGPLCSGQDLQLNTNTVTGTNVEYCWSGPNGFTSNDQNPFYEDIPFEGDGLYELIVKVDGCPSLPATLNIDIFEAPEVPTIDPVDPVCEGGSVTLVANSTDAGAIFFWTPINVFGPSVEIDNFSAADAIEYTVTVSLNGCDSEAMITLDLASPPTANAGTYNAVCSDNGLITLSGTPGGGEFTGAGVNTANSTFDPSIGAGSYDITYTVTDGNGCMGSDMTTITVNDLPVLDAGTYADICVDGDAIQLIGSPTGGTFSGNGVNSVTGMFDPSTLDGVITITYVYEDPTTMCENTETTTITVNPLPTPDAGTYASVCVDNGLVNLIGSPSGGTFSGNGVDEVNGTFDPTGQSGVVTIIYDYMDTNGCSASAQTTITVNDLPTADAGAYSAVCTDNGLVTLVGSPSGGEFTGTGVNTANSTFDPSIGAGSYDITYTVTDGNGCMGTNMTTIIVNDLPVLDAGTYADICVDGDAILLVGSPVGGTFSGDGVDSGTSMFDPATLDGIITITYTYEDPATLCENTETTTITVNPLPTPDAGTYAAVCVDNGLVNLVGTPAGGSFSGDGVDGVNSTFDPTGQSGAITITYDYMDANGCSASAQTTITVNDLPTADAGIYSAVCIDNGLVTLVGSPSGGEFTGTGVNTGNSTFDPSIGAGSYDITYTVTDGNGCMGTNMTTIIVNDLPVLDAGTYADICVDGDAILLVGSPVGGTFSGDGVDSGTSMFDPATLDGVITITYTYEDPATLCENTETTTITVNPLPTPDAGTYAAVCVDNGLVNLVGTPAGGSFSGDGVDGVNSTFDPTGQSGAITITYDYVDANGCSASAQTTITVNDLPTADAGIYSAVCIDNGLVTLVGSPSGGEFSGTGVDSANSTFDPNSGAGSYDITYTITDGNGCMGSNMTTILVNDLPILDAGSYADICVDGDAIQLIGSPSGGTWSGDGVSGDQFNPATLDGDITLTYTYENPTTLCENTTTTTITVNPLPSVDAGTYDALCADDAAINLLGSPSGGTWSGDGVSGNQFDPNVTGAGSWVLTYEVSDVNGCSNTAMVTIEVIDLPAVSIEEVSDICTDATPVTLEGSPSGGTFSGPGVTGTTFNPANANLGSNEITYIFENSAGCSNLASITINVLDLPVVDAGTYAAVCDGDADINLSGSQPDGVFTGTGVNGNVFEVSTQNPGNYTITYTYTTPEGCENSTTTDILINTLPAVNAGTYSPICEDDGAITLSGSPVGGTWSGDGIENGDEFNPALVGTGSWEVTYEASDANGCFNTSAVTIQVIELPTVSIEDVADICIDVDPITLIGNPSGGTFSGSGVTGTSFNPANANLGSNEISYIFENSAGCSNISTITINVIDLPVIFAGDYDDVCVDATPVSLSGSPAGGTFTGDGVTSDGLFFEPSETGAGTFTITYTASENGCENTTTTTIQVNDLPTVDAGTWDDLCIYEDALPLVGAPAGGIFSGSGVNSNNEFDPFLSGTGTHEITYIYADANECSNTATTMITVHPAPVVDAGDYTDLCENGDAITLMGSPAGGTFSINNADVTTFDPEDYGVGTFTITYIFEDANECSDIDESTITVLATPDTPSPTSNSAVCEGESIELSTSEVADAIYMWEGPNGWTSNLADPSIADADPAVHDGEYRVKITVNGCDSEWGMVNVTVNPTPDTPEPTNNGPLCEGEELVISVPAVSGNNVTYSWSGPSAFVSTDREIIIPEGGQDNAGQYCLIITIDGCESDFACTDVVITTNPEAPEITTTAPVCIGSEISFGTEVQADEYHWLNPDGSAFSSDQNPVIPISNLSHVGIYSLYIVSAEGCISDTSTIEVVVNELPVVSAGPFNDMCADESSIVLVGEPDGGTFSGDMIVGNVFDPSLVGAGVHSIDYTYTDLNGCSNTATTQITVSDIPMLELVSIDCSSDLNSYSITFNSDATVTAGAEIVSGNQVIDIDISNDVLLTAMNTAGCMIELPISAPQCDCEDVNAAVSGGDKDICFGDVTPTLNTTADVGLEIDWYGEAVGDASLLLSGSPNYTPIEDQVGEYTFYAEARNPIDDCRSSTRTPVTLIIKDLPTITNTELTQEICSGETFSGFELMSDTPGTTFNWTATAVDVNGFDTNGTGNISAAVLTTNSAQGTLTFTVEPSANGCPSDPVEFVVTVNGLPEITIENKECSSDLTSYTIFFMSDFDVSASVGTVSGNTIIDIPSETPVDVTVMNSATGCNQVITVTAPQCDCDEVELPISDGPVEICKDDPSGTLSVSVGSDITVQWFDTPVAGSSLGDGLTFTPSDISSGTHVYYAEATNTVTGCIATTRVEVEYIINELPTIVIDNKACTSDLTEYEITFSSIYTVIANPGSVSGNVITVDAGVNTILTITDSSTGCTIMQEVTAPQCDCDEVDPPTSNGNMVICEGETTPELSVTLSSSDLEAHWYLQPGVDLNHTGLAYTPDLEDAGTYIYEVEAVNTIDGCISDRIVVILTINALPTITIDSKECTADLTQYEIVFTSDYDVTSSEGSVAGNVITVSEGTNTILTITDLATGCSIMQEVTAPQCDCSEVPAPISGGDQVICEDDPIPTLTVNVDNSNLEARWYDENEISLGVTGNSYTPTVVIPGENIYFVDAINTVDGCISNTKTQITLTVNEAPSITIESKECTADLLSYEITFSSDETVAANPGTINGNIITVDAGVNTVLTITNTATGCEITQTIEAATCACDDIDAPISGGDAEICEGDAIPALSASVGTNEVVDWYEEDCTTLLLQGSDIYSPSISSPGTYTYCAQTRNTTDGCTSDMTTNISLTIHSLPEITIDNIGCSADLQTYTIDFSGSGIVSANPGNVAGNTVTVEAGMNTILMIEDATTGCMNTLEITAPICACDDIEEPVVVDNPEICFGEVIPILEVTSAPGTTVNWYENATTTVAILEGSLNFDPTVVDAGVYTFYVEAIQTIDGCTSDRIPVTLTIHALPQISIDAKDCSADMNFYTVTFSGDVTVTLNSQGTLTGNMISDISEGDDLTITFVDNVTGCESTQVVTSPNCDCDVVDAPINGGDVEICFEETTMDLSVTVPTGITVNWYNQSSGGTEIASGITTITPSEVNPGIYTYYAEAVAADGCISNTRTEVTYTIHALPTLSIDNKECSADLSTYTIFFTASGDISNASPGVLSGNTIIDIPSNTTVMISVEDPVTGCTENFDVEAPTCDCDEVGIPTVSNEEVCFGDTNPFFTAVTTSENTIDWFDASVGGNALLLGDAMYQSDALNAGVHTVYVQARNLTTGCISERVAVMLTIHELPSAIVSSAECTVDLSMYTVTLNTTAVISNTTNGSIDGIQIENIMADEDITITLVDPITGCENTMLIEAPDCDCAEVASPLSGGDREICFGETNPILEAIAAPGTTINWYESATATISLIDNSTTITPSETQVGVYSYFAEAVDDLTDCTSLTRVEVVFTIKALPTITNIDKTSEICSGESSNGYVITSDIPGATFTWTSSATNVTGNTSSGSGNIPMEALINTGNTASSVIYSVLPVVNGCEGAAVDFEVIVNPQPNAGSDIDVACFLEGEAILAATGNGSWSISNDNDGTLVIDDVSNPNARISSFEKAGTYRLIWTVNGCNDIIEINVGNDCPCEIEGNNVIDDVSPTYCMNTETLILIGEEAMPAGGEYLWEVSIDGGAFIPAPGINDGKDYDASNLGQGDYKYRRTYTIDDSLVPCADVSDEIEFLVFSDKNVPGEIMFTPNPVCQGDTLFLEVENYNAELNYNWEIMSGDARIIYTLDSMSNIVVNSAGKITVSVNQTVDGCADGLTSAATTLDLEVFATPQPQLGRDTTFCELDETFFLNPGDFVDYVWQDGSTDSEFEIEGEGIYSVEVMDTVGCIGKDEVDIKSFCCDFDWPNVFKPESFGPNSQFSIMDKYNCALTSKLYIFDRWGNMMFVGEDTYSWDGTFNGRPVEQGVYVFIFEYSAQDANREIFEDKLSGDITILRNK